MANKFYFHDLQSATLLLATIWTTFIYIFFVFISFCFVVVCVVQCYPPLSAYKFFYSFYLSRNMVEIFFICAERIQMSFHLQMWIYTVGLIRRFHKANEEEEEKQTRLKKNCPMLRNSNSWARHWETKNQGKLPSLSHKHIIKR